MSWIHGSIILLIFLSWETIELSLWVPVLFKEVKSGHMWWYMPVIPAVWEEAQAEGS
jgi:hypothetical protein